MLFQLPISGQKWRWVSTGLKTRDVTLTGHIVSCTFIHHISLVNTPIINNTISALLECNMFVRLNFFPYLLSGCANQTLLLYRSSNVLSIYPKHTNSNSFNIHYNYFILYTIYDFISVVILIHAWSFEYLMTTKMAYLFPYILVLSLITYHSMMSC